MELHDFKPIWEAYKNQINDASGLTKAELEALLSQPSPVRQSYSFRSMMLNAGVVLFILSICSGC